MLFSAPLRLCARSFCLPSDFRPLISDFWLLPSAPWRSARDIPDFGIGDQQIGIENKAQEIAAITRMHALPHAVTIPITNSYFKLRPIEPKHNHSLFLSGPSPLPYVKLKSQGMSPWIDPAQYKKSFDNTARIWDVLKKTMCLRRLRQSEDVFLPAYYVYVFF